MLLNEYKLGVRRMSQLNDEVSETPEDDVFLSEISNSGNDRRRLSPDAHKQEAAELGPAVGS